MQVSHLALGVVQISEVLAGLVLDVWLAVSSSCAKSACGSSQSARPLLQTNVILLIPKVPGGSPGFGSTLEVSRDAFAQRIS